MDEVSLSNDVPLLKVLLVSVLFIIVSDYGLDMKKLYPVWAIHYFAEPIVRFAMYVLIYFTACYSPLVAILLALITIFIHIDLINLAKHNDL
jgi:hypothetical protein